MTQLHFYKYQGTGNDFILLDNRQGNIRLDKARVAGLCNRRFGIGADGLMLLEEEPGSDFRMVYYNADGGESTMCGNGGRCIVAFAQALGIIGVKTVFRAIDGLHHATIEADGTVSLEMKDVDTIRHFDGYCVLDTGSPHYVRWTEDVQRADVFHEGRRLRNLPEFAPAGINVNFVQRLDNRSIAVRTYERGVEDETLSCGTGVTAAAIAASGMEEGEFLYAIDTPGGMLRVSFLKTGPDSAAKVILRGPATPVFEGTIPVKDF